MSLMILRIRYSRLPILSLKYRGFETMIHPDPLDQAQLRATE